MKFRGFNNKEYEVSGIVKREIFKRNIKKTIEGLKKDLVIEDSGMTVYTKNKDLQLSPGCKSCKNGRWWCIFVGNRCNAACKFCPQNKEPRELLAAEDPDLTSSFHIDEIKLYLEKFGNKLEGVSYSGGEPFLYLDKVYKIAKMVKQSNSEIYQWIYTNGKLITEENLKKLKSVGIKEIRVDLAATDFNDKIVEKLEICSTIIERVTVEVPSIPEVFKKLTSEGYLQKIANLGVTQLNLAELELSDDRVLRNYAVNEDVYEYYTRNSRHASPVYSRKLTYHIIRHAMENDIDILINDCSNDTKDLQILMRTYNLPEVMH